jgi:hypothetical protein
VPRAADGGGPGDGEGGEPPAESHSHFASVLVETIRGRHPSWWILDSVTGRAHMSRRRIGHVGLVLLGDSESHDRSSSYPWSATR